MTSVGGRFDSCLGPTCSTFAFILLSSSCFLTFSYNFLLTLLCWYLIHFITELVRLSNFEELDVLNRGHGV